MTWMWPVSSNGAQVRHRAVRAEAQIDCGSQAIEGDAQGTPPQTNRSIRRNAVETGRRRQATYRAELGQRSVGLDRKHPDRSSSCVQRVEKPAVRACRDIDVARGADGPQGAIRIHGVGRDRRAVRGAIHPRERLKRITPGPAVRQSGSARGIRDDEQRRLQGDACSAAAAKIALIMKLR